MQQQTSLSLFGGFNLSLPLRPARLPTRKTEALVAYLALHPNQPLGRSFLAGLLWDGQSEDAARQSLRQALTSIRQVLGQGFLSADRDFVTCRGGHVVVDVLEFQKVARGRELGFLEQADRLYGGDFLSGLETGSPEFDAWIVRERASLSEIAHGNAAQLLARRSEDGELRDAVQIARRVIALDPFDEGAHRHLMRLYVRQGRHSQALRHFRDLVKFLDDELDVAPDGETVWLHEQIRAARHKGAPRGDLLAYTSVLERLGQSVVVTDKNARVVGWNKAAEQEFGFTKDEMYDRTPSMLYAPHRDLEVARKIMRHVISTGRWSSEAVLMTKAGKLVHQVRTVLPLVDHDGVIVGSFGIGNWAA